MAREINLVPDSKVEAIKSLKLRNLALFISIIIASASVVVSLISLAISGGQRAAIDGKKQTIDSLSSKMAEFGDLNDFLTIKDQLGNLVPITENKFLLYCQLALTLSKFPNSPLTYPTTVLRLYLTPKPTLAKSHLSITTY